MNTIFFIVISLFTFSDNECEKYIFESSHSTKSMCIETWDKIMKGIYIKSCENNNVVYITNFSKDSPKFYLKNKNGENEKC